MKRVFSLILLISLPVLYTVLENIDNASVTTISNNNAFYPILHWISINKFFLVVSLSAINAIIGAIIGIIVPEIKLGKRLKCTRAGIMEAMCDELFSGRHNETRITIFRDLNLLNSLLAYVIGIIKGRMHVLKHYPYRKRFLCVWQRTENGTEYPKSKTKFVYSLDTIDDCEGIAGRTRFKEAKLIVNNLPDICSINVKEITEEILKKNKTNEAKKVNEYMKQGHIRNLITLKNVHRLARHFWAEVIYSQNSKPIGVIVIDSTNEVSPFTDAVDRKLDYYVRLVGHVV